MATVRAEANPPAVAFFYGASPPLDELAAFDAVVLEPSHLAGAPSGKGTLWFAYVSVGEVEKSRPYFADLPAGWQIGRNPAFGSVVIDQAQPDWPAFFAERVVAPLWARGWRGFFLDTLDSYQLAAATPEARERQEAGLVAVVRALRARFPGVKLFFNRGFEILPRVHAEAWGVAAESLYRAYDHGGKSYREVSAADRAWLSGQLARVRDDYKLPAVAIDYVAPAEREQARADARRITADGFVPWVANPGLDQLGVGAVEVMPRRVLLLYEKRDAADQLIYKDAHRVGALPLEWLGYIPEYLNIASDPLPEGPLAGRYAGIVAWLTDETAAGERLYPWLRRQMQEGVRVAFFSSFGFRLDGARAEALGLALGQVQRPPASLKVRQRDPALGFETPVEADRRSFLPLTVKDGNSLLQLVDGDGNRMDPVALTAWGGYALFPYHVITLPGAGSKRWVVDPFAFLARALALPAMPVPDVTTESGRRLLMVHIDGDGFPSRAERPGGPVAAQVLLDEILRRYRIPQTVSVIEGEIAALGLHPAESPALEAIARRIFALPNVEIASHTLSHPFRWQALERSVESGGEGAEYSLKLPGYSYDVRAEIGGSIDYINRRLAPPGKPVRILLWSGDCNPDDLPLAETARAGVLNMNGGDTTITRADPTLTRVAPMGIPRGPYYQVYAPNQNENVYTGLWHGPYYGYERVIETFELTELPRRLKPVNIYYHMYSTTKTASLAALHKVYRWALAQRLYPVRASEYIQRVLDFRAAVVARTANGWRVRGLGSIRTVRAPAALGTPVGDVAGSIEHAGSIYALLTGPSAELSYGAGSAPGPRLRDANARVLSFERRGTGARLSLAGHVPIEFSLSGNERCEVRFGNRAVARGADGSYRIAATEADGIDLRCP